MICFCLQPKQLSAMNTSKMNFQVIWHDLHILVFVLQYFVAHS